MKLSSLGSAYGQPKTWDSRRRLDEQCYISLGRVRKVRNQDAKPDCIYPDVVVYDMIPNYLLTRLPIPALSIALLGGSLTR